MAHARIGKIRLKSGGAEVRVLHRATRPDGENFKGLIVEHARMIAEGPTDMVGFVVIGIFRDGSYNSGSRLDRDAQIGRTMLPAYVAEIVRREVITEPLVDGEI